MSGTVTVGEAARLTGVSAKMIRWYEGRGLLPPAPRTEAGYRRYGDAEIRTLHFVRRARDLGFDVEAIGELLALWQDRERPSAAVKAIAEGRIAELRRRIVALEGMARSLERLAAACCGDGRPDCPILDDLAADEEVPPTRRARPSPLRPPPESLAESRRLSQSRPHPEVPPRSGGLEGDLQKAPRFLKPSFEAAIAAPQDEGGGGKQEGIRNKHPTGRKRR
jgi:Cu(I)-responsive transcriptional regulator